MMKISDLEVGLTEMRNAVEHGRSKSYANLKSVDYAIQHQEKERYAVIEAPKRCGASSEWCLMDREASCAADTEFQNVLRGCQNVGIGYLRGGENVEGWRVERLLRGCEFDEFTFRF